MGVRVHVNEHGCAQAWEGVYVSMGMHVHGCGRGVCVHEHGCVFTSLGVGGCVCQQGCGRGVCMNSLCVHKHGCAWVWEGCVCMCVGGVCVQEHCVYTSMGVSAWV